jgi:16S rRNA (uracil1498-N3)-methyltransferase
MRSRVGDKVILCCDKIDYDCEIIRITKTETVLSVGDYTPVTTEPELDVTLYPAILKGDKMEFVVQKCTELGVNAIIPFVSTNCECRPTAVRVDRLKKIAEEASKQCGRGIIPTVGEVIDFSALLGELDKFDLVVFPYENAKETDLKSFLRKIENVKKVAIIVGSEGGFREEEAKMIEEKGVSSVSLGSRIMRAETASVAVLSAIMYEMDEWRIKQ